MRATLAAACAVALAGCLQAGTPGTVGAVADTSGGADARDTSPVGAARDTVSDTSTCLPGALSVAGGILADPLTPWAVRVTAPGAVAFSGAPWPEAADNVHTWVPAGGGPAAEISLPDGATVIDGRDGALLVDYPIPGDRRRRLRYVDEAWNAELTELDERLWVPDRHDPPHHLVRKQRAAFRSCFYDGQGGCIEMKLRAWTPGDGLVRTLWEGPGGGVAPTAPLVTEEAVLWAAPAGDSDGQWEIRELRDGAVTTVLDVDGPVHEIVAHTRGALWTTPAGVFYAKPDGEPRRLHDGPCVDLDSDGTMAVMVCPERDTGGRSVWLPPTFAQLGRPWLYAGGEELGPVTAEAEIVGYPRVDRGLVAWLSFPDVTDDCFDRGPGRVMVASTRTQAPVEVAEIETTCFCCAAIWPPHALSLGHGLLAWTYAPSDAAPTDPPWNTTRLGWAQVRSCE